MAFVSYAALIRGAIAMGLIQKLDPTLRDSLSGFDRKYDSDSKLWDYG